VSVPAGKEGGGGSTSFSFSTPSALLCSALSLVAVTMRSIDPAECFRVRRKPLSLRRRRRTKKERDGRG
jgi:hypothetical protein